MVASGERPDLWGSLTASLSSASQRIQEIRVINVSSTKAIETVKNAVNNYFYTYRPPLVSVGIEVQNLDALMQELLRLTNRRSLVSKYKNILKSLRTEIATLESDSLIMLSENPARDGVLLTTRIENLIIETLQRISPPTAQSYIQVLNDLYSNNRISYRGTAGEIREVLREVLDKLAPDKDVESSPGFKFEKDKDNSKALTKPTMKQKARFILKSRGIPSGAIKTPEDAVGIVEESIASLARSTYNRGSIGAHTERGIEKAEIKQLKMYVDTVLCELLALQP